MKDHFIRSAVALLDLDLQLGYGGFELSEAVVDVSLEFVEPGIDVLEPGIDEGEFAVDAFGIWPR